MNRKLSLFLIVSFLGMQMLSFLHMDEFGFDEHEHNDQICQIYLHCEHTKYSMPSAAIDLQAPDYAALTIALPELIFVRSKNYGDASPRAPPLFS